MALDKWHSYLQHSEFLIRTDQQSRVHLNDKRLTTRWQHKALTKLLGLQYKITYKKGHENVVADALSHCTESSAAALYSISCSTPVWFEDIAQGYYYDPQAQKRLATLASGTPWKPFEPKQALIRHKGEFGWAITQ